MKTNNETGRKIVIIIGLYLFVKFIINIFFGGFDFGALLFAVVAFVAMFSGLKYLNYAVAGLLTLMVATHLLHNLTHLPGTFIFLLEGVIDIGAAYLLIMKDEVKEHFTNDWKEIADLIKK